MAEKLQEQLQKEFQRMGDNVDRQHIRPLQKAAYLCMAKCFDNPKASLESVQACTQRCEQRLQAVNHVVQEEVNTFQGRMQRCSLACQDEARDMLPPGAREGDPSVERAMAHHLKCFGDCVKKHMALLPGIEARIKAAATASGSS